MCYEEKDLKSVYVWLRRIWAITSLLGDTWSWSTERSPAGLPVERENAADVPKGGSTLELGPAGLLQSPGSWGIIILCFHSQMWQQVIRLRRRNVDIRSAELCSVALGSTGYWRSGALRGVAGEIKRASDDSPQCPLSPSNPAFVIRLHLLGIFKALSVLSVCLLFVIFLFQTTIEMR